MKFVLKTTVLLAALVIAGCKPQPDAEAPAPAPAPAPAKVLKVYNWSDYIAPDTIANFEAETGIDVTYDVFDSNEVLEAKLMAGATGYDIVVPTMNFLARQIKAGVFKPLDRARLTNFGNLDPEFMALMAQNDPGNAHAIPYLWGTTGIGYNVAKVTEALGAAAPVDSWALVLEPENLAKLKGCGVAFLDTPSDIIPTVLNYLGEDPNSFDPAVIQKAVDRLLALRPHITYFHSSLYINDLANGDICVAVGWSGDIIQARNRAAEAGRGVEVRYVIPKEGAMLWTDMLAIPRDARNIDNAYLFLDFLLRPEVKAGIQNYVAFASANDAAKPLVNQEIRDDPGIYPTAEARAKLFTPAVLPAEVDRLYTRHWTMIKAGR